MSAGPRSCASCGATVARSEARTCEVCGGALPPAPDAAPEPRPADVAGRFARGERHPDAARALAAGSPLASAGARAAAGALTLVVFVALGLLVTAGLSMVFPPLALVPLTLVVLGAVLIVRNLARSLREASAPVVRALALVADDRTSISGGGGDRSVTTERSVTLEFRDGTRRDVVLGDELSGELARGDIGVASLRNDVLVGFARVDV